jgi:adenylate kinase family enzyme
MSELGRRIVVYGPSGSGKTTLSRMLGEQLGLAVVELDAIYHCRPGWNDLSEEEYREAVREVLAANPDGWVIDGNYGMVRDLILPNAETAIWLRLPLRVVYPRLFWRTVSRAWRRDLLWGVNRESWRLSFFSRESILLWGFTNWRPHRTKTRAALREAKASGTRIVVLRSPREVRQFEATITRQIETAPARA